MKIVFCSQKRQSMTNCEKSLKKSRYDKDKKFVKSFHNNVNFSEEIKKSVPIKATFVEKKDDLDRSTF